jgi:hypothetical protein
MGRKRANNEGTIYYRSDRQAWCAQITIEGHRMTDETRRKPRSLLSAPAGLRYYLFSPYPLLLSNEFQERRLF